MDVTNKGYAKHVHVQAKHGRMNCITSNEQIYFLKRGSGSGNMDQHGVDGDADGGAAVRYTGENHL